MTASHSSQEELGMRTEEWHPPGTSEARVQKTEEWKEKQMQAAHSRAHLVPAGTFIELQLHFHTTATPPIKLLSTLSDSLDCSAWEDVVWAQIWAKVDKELNFCFHEVLTLLRQAQCNIQAKNFESSFFVLEFSTLRMILFSS